MNDQRNTPAIRAGLRSPSELPRMVERAMNERAIRRAALVELRERERAQQRRTAPRRARSTRTGV